jgi:hypothetical protein
MTRAGKRSPRFVAGLVAGLVGVLVVLRVVVVVVALDSAATSAGPRIHRGASREHATVLPGDVRRYHRIATRRGVAYRDFEVEYPPLTLAAIDALNGHNVRESTVNLMWSQLVVDLAIAGVIAWAWGRRAALLYLLLGLAFLWYPFLYLRLDLLSVLLAVSALALVKRGSALAGGAGLAVACFAKLWPFVLVPRLMVRRAWSGVVAFAAVGLAGLGLWVALAGTDGPEQVLTFRGADGWQIESTLGAWVHTFGSARAHVEQGAMRAGMVPTVARLGLPVLGIVLVVVIWWLTARTRSTSDRVLDGLAPLGAVTALLVTATILSPQYVSWLLPFAAIAAAGGERLVGALTAVAAVLSTLGLNLVKELNRGDAFPAAVVILRNAVLVALFVVVVVRLVRSRPSPGVTMGVPARTPTGLPVGASVPDADLVGAAPLPVGGSRDGSRLLGREDQVPATITARSLGPIGGLLAPRRDRRS